MRLPYNRGGLRWYLLILSLLAAKATTLSILSGVLPLVLGILIHIWAKGCLHQNQEVTRSGPYRLVRHPFYLGNLLIDVGIVIMSGSWLLMGAFPIWWLVVYLPVMRREEGYLIAVFGEAYTDYMRQVPRLLPLWPPAPGISGFSWRNPNLLRTELPRAFRFLSYPFLFVLAREIREALTSSQAPRLHVVLIALLAILATNALAWRVRRGSSRSTPLHARWLSWPTVVVFYSFVFILSSLPLTDLEIEQDAITWPVGLALVGISLFLQHARPRRGVLALLVLMIGATTLLELPWLSFVPILLWLPIWLHDHLAPPAACREKAAPGFTSIALGRLGFFVMSLVFVLAALIKETII